MKLKLYKWLFNWIDKDWNKTVENYTKLKDIVKNIPKNFSNIQILTKKISYQWSGKLIKVKDIKQKEDYHTIQDFYNNHDYIYSFFILNKNLENNLINTQRLFNFIDNLNKKDKETIIKELKNNIEKDEKDNPLELIISNISNRILSILKYNKNQEKYWKLHYRVSFNDLLKVSKDVINWNELKILYLMLSKKFWILNKDKEKILNSDKVKRIISENDFLNKYIESFDNYKDWYIDIYAKDIWLNFINYFIKKDLNDFLWLYTQEKMMYEELKILDSEKYFDFSFKIWDNTFRWVSSWEDNQLIFTIRIVWKPLDLEEKFFLYIPAVLKENMLSLFKRKDGLIVVSGSTWSWKTTFLISALDFFNKTDSINRLVYTVENPIEYWFEASEYEFIQKQLWKNNDINKMSDGIKIALRSQPNIIFVWETRDYETAKELLAATESWHLTITTMHLNNPWDILTRLSNLTDTEKWLVQDQLSKNLLATINMWLIPAKITDIATGEKVDTVLPYFSILKPDNQIKVLLSEGDSKNIIALFTEYEKIMSGAVWPKELTLFHYYRQGLILKEQMEIISDPMILHEVEVLYDRIFTRNVDM